jgi:hypothetical protein
MFFFSFHLSENHSLLCNFHLIFHANIYDHYNCQLYSRNERENLFMYGFGKWFEVSDDLLIVCFMQLPTCKYWLAVKGEKLTKIRNEILFIYLSLNRKHDGWMYWIRDSWFLSTTINVLTMYVYKRRGRARQSEKGKPFVCRAYAMLVPILRAAMVVWYVGSTPVLWEKSPPQISEHRYDLDFFFSKTRHNKWQ